jgi:hypothetical protein
MLVFDHLKLVRRDVQEVSKFRIWLLSSCAGTVENCVHASGGSSNGSGASSGEELIPDFEMLVLPSRQTNRVQTGKDRQ